MPTVADVPSTQPLSRGVRVGDEGHRGDCSSTPVQRSSGSKRGGCRRGWDWRLAKTHRRAARALTPAGARRGGTDSQDRRRPSRRPTAAAAGPPPRTREGGPPATRAGGAEARVRAAPPRPHESSLRFAGNGPAGRTGAANRRTGGGGLAHGTRPPRFHAQRENGYFELYGSKWKRGIGAGKVRCLQQSPRRYRAARPAAPPSAYAEESPPSLAPRPTGCPRRVSPRVARCRGAAAPPSSTRRGRGRPDPGMEPDDGSGGRRSGARHRRGAGGGNAAAGAGRVTIAAGRGRHACDGTARWARRGPLPPSVPLLVG